MSPVQIPGAPSEEKDLKTGETPVASGRGSDREAGDHKGLILRA